MTLVLRQTANQYFKSRNNCFPRQSCCLERKRYFCQETTCHILVAYQFVQIGICLVTFCNIVYFNLTGMYSWLLKIVLFLKILCWPNSFLRKASAFSFRSFGHGFISLVVERLIFSNASTHILNKKGISKCTQLNITFWINFALLTCIVTIKNVEKTLLPEQNYKNTRLITWLSDQTSDNSYWFVPNLAT